MSRNKKLLHSTILASVSVLAIASFAQDAQAERRFTGSGTASATPGGGVAGSATYNDVGGVAGNIIVQTGVHLTNDGTTGTGAPNGEVILLDDTDAGWNRLTLQNNSSVTLTGGTNSTVFLPGVNGGPGFTTPASATITLGTGATIAKADGTGNAIYGSLGLGNKSMTIVNNGTISAANGATGAANNGAVVLETLASGSFSLTGTGNITRRNACCTSITLIVQTCVNLRVSLMLHFHTSHQAALIHSRNNCLQNPSDLFVC